MGRSVEPYRPPQAGVIGVPHRRPGDVHVGPTPGHQCDGQRFQVGIEKSAATVVGASGKHFGRGAASRSSTWKERARGLRDDARSPRSSPWIERSQSEWVTQRGSEKNVPQSDGERPNGALKVLQPSSRIRGAGWKRNGSQSPNPRGAVHQKCHSQRWVQVPAPI